MRGVAVRSVALWIGLASAGRCETPSTLTTPIAAVSSNEAKPTADNEQPAGEIAAPQNSQEGIQRRDQAAEPKQQIRIDLKICELSLTKMRQLGIDILELGRKAAGDDRSKTTKCKSVDTTRQATIGVVDSDGIAAMVAMLRREKVLKLLTDNQQIVTEGRTAYFLGSTETASPVRSPDWSKQSCSRKFGTQVDLTATLLGANRIRLTVRAKLCEVDPSTTITLNGEKVLGFRKREMDIPVEMDLGKTALISGLVQENVEVVVDPKAGQKANVFDTTQMLVLIKPELVDAATK
ncbi:MAG TPA: hypothetical protein VHY91_09410 [Pirellulales bacterium]|jgi:Flp pilus assembly secretin CpaC|nr:hypothetical protein [Pirellulales bacterium]